MRQLLSMLMLVAVAGCAGSSGVNDVAVSPVGAPAELPSVAALELSASIETIPPRSASEVAASRNGADYSSELMEPKRTSPAGDKALFEPVGTGPDDYACALYVFSLPEFAQGRHIRTTWTLPPDADRLWIAIANRAEGRWDWIDAEAGTHSLIPDIAPYLSEEDQLVAAVLTIREGQYMLDTIAVSGAPPEIHTVAPRWVDPGESVTFEVFKTGSDTVSCSWNLGGGTIPDEGTGDVLTVLAGAEGIYTGMVDAVNPLGSDHFEFEYYVKVPPEPAAGELVALADSNATSVGVPVLITVLTGPFPEEAPFAYMNGVAVTVPEGADYVDYTFNLGSPGGELHHPDGIWEAVGTDSFLSGQDSLITPVAVDGNPELIFLRFSITPIGPSEILDEGALFNFEMTFDEPGEYQLGFLIHQSVDRTYYSDSVPENHYWLNTDNDHERNTIQVLE